MPKVDQYQPNQVASTVVRQPRASGQVPDAAFGGPVAQGAGDLAQAGLDLKRRIDTTAAEEALIQFERDKNELFITGENAYFNTQGRTAYDTGPTASAALDKLQQQHGEALAPQAKIMFDEGAAPHITRGRVDIGRHSASGLRTWKTSTLAAKVENTMENAALYHSDPEILRTNREEGENAVIDSGNLKGIGTEAITENIQTYRSKFAKIAIDAATAQSSGEGQALLDTHGDQLEGPDRVKVEKGIETKAKIEKTQADAQQAILTATRMVNDGMTRAEIKEEAEMTQDLDLRKKIKSEANRLLSEQARAERETEKDNYHAAIGMVNGTATTRGLSPGEIAATNPEVWEGMDDLQRNNILAGKHLTTDQIKLGQILSLSRNQLKDFDTTTVVSEMKPSDYQKIEAAKRRANQDLPSDRTRTLSFKTMEVARDAFPGKWKNKNGERTPLGDQANAFLTEVDAIIEETQANKPTGQKLTPTEENQLLDDATAEVAARRVGRFEELFDIEFFSDEVQLDLQNTPTRDLRLLNQFIRNTPGIGKIEVIDAYQSLIERGFKVTQERLDAVISQGKK